MSTWQSQSSDSEIAPNLIRNVEPSEVNTRRDNLVNSGLEDYRFYFEQAGILVIDPLAWKDDGMIGRRSGHAFEIKETQYAELQQEKGTVWQKLTKLPWPMWQLVLLCGLGAMVQGWDEAAVNGAQVYFQGDYNLTQIYNYNMPDPANFAGNTDPFPEWVALYDASMLGLINGAPYLCCFISCWFSWPLNHFFGRRWTIFLAALCSIGFCIGQAFANDKMAMFTLRFLLGLGIGPKSATIPIYAAECAPHEVRGALVMMWQLFTALGIMLGYLSGVAFASVTPGTGILQLQTPPAETTVASPIVNQCAQDPLSYSCSLNWRLMIGSPAIAPVFLALYIFVQPESPRWMIYQAQRASNKATERERNYPEESDRLNKKSRHLNEKVFTSLVRLRGGSKLRAARDMLVMDILLWRQENRGYDLANDGAGSNRTKRQGLRYHGASVVELFTNPRNLSALRASTILMFLQQYCGINVLIYYSSLVLFEAGKTADLVNGNIPSFILASFGIGAINFLFGLPAILLIDRVGRRKLLLWTFPFMAIFMAWVALASLAYKHATLLRGLTITGMVMFAVAYSPGEGPVPFVYAAESFPQATRDLGMGVVTSINWALNFLVAVTFPAMSYKWEDIGAFFFYAAWSAIGWFLIFFFVPETKGIRLEQLDVIFNKTLAELWDEGWRKLRDWRPTFRSRQKRRHLNDEDMEMNGMSNGHTTGFASGAQPPESAPRNERQRSLAERPE